MTNQQVSNEPGTVGQEPPAEDHGMRNTLLVIGGVIVVIAALAVLLNLGDKPAAAPPAAAVSYTPVTHTVTYVVEGESTTAATYTIQTDDGGTQQGEADLPLRNKAGGYGLTFDGFASGAFVYLSAQNDNGYGSVTCKILVDGDTISENTSTGGYAIATCSSRVP
ncbi:MAG TPA: hypothetical protein VG497_30625 [Kribbella sp.]|nr:hypothetical protein [Kribbella sp.]